MSLIELEFVHIKCYGKINRALAGAESLFVNAELFAIVGFVFCNWIYGHNTYWSPHLSEIFLSQTDTITALKHGARYEANPTPCKHPVSFCRLQTSGQFIPFDQMTLSKSLPTSKPQFPHL